MRFLGTLFLLAIALSVIAYIRGWLIVDTAQGASGESTRVVVDEDRVAADLDAAGRSVARLSQRAKEIVTGKAKRNETGALVIDAEVLTVEPAAARLQVRIDGSPVLFDAPEAVQVVVDGAPASLGELRVGSTVRLTIEADGDELCLRRVATV